MLNVTTSTTCTPRSTRVTLTRLFRNRPAAMSSVVARASWAVTRAARDLAAARAEGQTDAHLHSAAGAARQQEIRDIGARDEEHDPGDAEQHEQRRLRVAVHGALPPRARSEDDPLHPELGHELITHALVERRLDVGHDG